MGKYKITPSFFKIGFSLALGFGGFSAWAYNSMCYSPVQLAALMSPDKPKLSKETQLKKRVSALEKKLEDYENKMDDEAGKLGDSLSQEKLNDDPYDTASAVRSYIEKPKDSWSCVENRTSSFLKQDSLFYLQDRFVNINFLELLIPSAYAEKSDSSGKTGKGSEETIEVPQRKPLQVDPCGASGGERDEDGNCICPAGQVLKNDTCVLMRAFCIGGTLDENTKDCICPAGQVLKNDRCVKPTTKKASTKKPSCSAGQVLEEGQCVKCSSKPGGKWTWTPGDIKCRCEEGKNIILKEGQCREKTDQEKCESTPGKEWRDSKCKKKKSLNAICIGGTLDENTKDCICPAGQVLKNDRCVKPTTKKASTKKPSCSAGQVLEEGQCVKCSDKPGGKWMLGVKGKSCKCDVGKNKNIKLDGKECREKTDQEKCKDQKAMVWTGDSCKTQDQIDKKDCESTPGKEWIGEECKDTPKAQCENQDGKEWKDRKCQDTPESECKNRKGNWEYNNGDCICPAPYEEKGKLCRKKNKSERCKDKGGTFNEFNKCVCPPEHKLENEKCVPKTDQDKCEDKEGMSWSAEDGKCVECSDWKKHSAFGKNGKVDSRFCEAYAKNKRACKNAISRMGRLADRLEKYKDRIEKLTDEIENLDDSETVTTEARGVCIDCLKRQLKANRPTAGQTFGNIASMLAGVGLGMAGYDLGRNTQMNTNMLRIKQGYPVANDNYALQGATVGFPFIANGIYGMTRANTPVGGWSCTPSVNPYGYAYGHYGYGYGYRMPYY